MSLVFTNCDVVGNVSILDGCCCEHTCLLENQFATPVTITNIANSTSGGGANSNVVVEIGGVAFTPPSGAPLPYILNAGASVEIKWRSCANNPPVLTNDVTTITYQDSSGAVSTYTKTMRMIPVTLCDMLTIDGNPYPAIMDFGFVQSGTSQDVIVAIENPTACDIEVTYNDNCSDPQLTYNQPDPFVVPALTTINLVATWSPLAGSSGSLSCTLTLNGITDGCENACDLDVTGISSATAPCLTCDEITLMTEGTYLDDQTSLCEVTAGHYIQGAIGEKKTLKFEYTYANGLQTGLKIYFNPFLYSYDCNWLLEYPSGVIDSPMNVSYFIEYYAGMPQSTMNIVNGGANTENQRNFECLFNPINANEFQILFTYYHIEDIDQPMNGTQLSNQGKLLHNYIYNPVPLDNSDACVYNQLKKFCGLFYLIDPNIQVLDPASGLYSDFECYNLESIPYTLRFYNTGLLGQPAEMTNPTWIFFRNGANVTNFSTITPTQVKFQITHTSAVTEMVAWLIDMSKFDNSVDFYENYDSSRVAIPTSLAGVLDNHIITPSVAVTGLGGNVYQTTFHVGTSVDPSGVYHCLLICYDKNNNIVNTFISNQLNVTTIPDPNECCDMEFTPVFSDYFTTNFTEYWQPCVKERYRYQLTMLGSDLETCIDDWGGVGADWHLYCDKIEFRVQEENVDFPSVGQTTYVLYDKGILTRQNGTPTGWASNNASLSNLEGSIFGSNFMSLEYGDKRIRWESQLIPSMAEVETTGDPSTRIDAGAMASTYISTLGSNYDWSNKDVFVETKLFFDFSALFGQTFELVVIYKSKMTPLGVGDLNSSGNGLDEIKFFRDDKATEIGETFCADEITCLWVRTHKTWAGIGRAFASISSVLSSINTIEEENGMYSTLLNQMQNLMTDKLCNVDNEYDGSDYAWFSVDLSKLSAGQYELCGFGNISNGAIVPVPNVDLNCPCEDPAPPPFTNLLSTSFDGIDDYVDTGQNQASFGITNQMTCSFWAKGSGGVGAFDTIVGSSSTYPSPPDGFGFYWVSNTIRFYINSFNSHYSSATCNLNDGNWYHIVGTFDGQAGASPQQIRVYVNGVGGTWDNHTNNVLGSANMLIGKASGSMSYMAECKVDEVSIYDYCMTPAEVLTLYNGGVPSDLDASGLNPQGWWRMGDGATFPNIPNVGAIGGSGTMNNMDAGDFVADVP